MINNINNFNFAIFVDRNKKMIVTIYCDSSLFWQTYLPLEGVMMTVTVFASVNILYRFLNRNFGLTRPVEENSGLQESVEEDSGLQESAEEDSGLQESVSSHGTSTYFREIMSYNQGIGPIGIGPIPIGPEGQSEVIPHTVFYIPRRLRAGFLVLRFFEMPKENIIPFGGD